MNPPWRPYDPGDSLPPEALSGDSAVLALLVTRQAAAGGWAARATASLARGWAAAGQRVFVADLGLARPLLEETLPADGAEGMTDLFLYGASLRRIARSAPGGWFFASAGTPAVDAAAVLESSRWPLLARGFSRAGARLVVVLHADEPGVERIGHLAGQVLVLAGRGEADAVPALPLAAERVSLVLTPGGGAGDAPEAPVEQAGAPSAGAGVEGAVETPADVPGAEAPAPPSGEPEGPGADLAGPVPWASEADSPSPVSPPLAGSEAIVPTTGTATVARRGLLLGGGLVLLLALLAGLARMGIVPLPGRGDADGGAASDPTEGGPPAPSPAPALGPSGTYFVGLGDYPPDARPRLQAEYLREQRPELLFIVAPIEVDGQPFYRLLAGGTEDPEGRGLREALAPTLPEEDPSGWVVRAAPLAFHLGSFATLEEARARVAELGRSEIPSYVLETTGPGEPAFDVWAGGYADPAEAAHLSETLQFHGIEPRLLRRRGELPR